MGNAGSKLSDPGEMLCFTEALFQIFSLPELLDHLIETLGKLPDFIGALDRNSYRKVSCRNFADIDRQPLNRMSIASGKKDDQDHAETEYHAGGDKAADKVVMLDFADIVEEEIDLHVAELLVADNDRHNKIVWFQRG